MAKTILMLTAHIEAVTIHGFSPHTMEMFLPMTDDDGNPHNMDTLMGEFADTIQEGLEHMYGHTDIAPDNRTITETLAHSLVGFDVLSFTATRVSTDAVPKNWTVGHTYSLGKSRSGR